MFSYGSGAASTLFLLKVHQNTEFMRKKMNVKANLQNRIKISPEEFNQILQKKQEEFGKPSIKINVLIRLFNNLILIKNRFYLTD